MIRYNVLHRSEKELPFFVRLYGGDMAVQMLSLIITCELGDDEAVDSHLLTVEIVTVNTVMS